MSSEVARDDGAPLPFEAILDGLSNGVTVQDAAGRLIYANDSAARILGFPSGRDLLAAPLSEVMRRFEVTDEAGRPFPLERLPGRLALGGEPGPETLLRYRVLATGEEHWSLVAARPLFDPRGRVRFAINVFRDVTGRRRTEAELRESEARFRVMADTAPVMIWVAGVDKLRTFFNRPWLEFTGRSMQQEIGDGWAEGIHPDDYERCLQTYRSSFDARDSFRMEYRLRRIDGAYRWVLDSGVPRHGPGGTFAGYIGSTIDIAERKRAEEWQRFLLEASQQLAGSLELEATLATVARLAVSHFADWCVLDLLEEDGSIRPAAAAHRDPAKEPLVRELQLRYGLDPEVPHRARVMRLGESVRIAEVSESILKAAARDAGHLELLRALDPRSLLIVPLVARGRILGSLFLACSEPGSRYGEADQAWAEDLARRCAVAIDNARLYREAHDAIRARDEFLSVAAHELRTPITGLQGFAQLTLRQLRRQEQPDPDRLRQGLEVINEQAGKLSRLVSLLLDISRIEGGQLRLEPERTDVTALVDRAVATARATTARHTIAHRGPSELWATVDRLRLEQVLANLLDNAIKYSPDGGPIELELSSTAGAVRIAVTDRGLGIPPEQRARIFERFHQAHADRNLAGLGLGLFVTREIVHLHGGRIEAEFPDEGGARFVVTLPA